MGRNSKSFDAGRDGGAQLVGLSPIEASNPRENTDSRLVLPQGSSGADEGDLGHRLAEGNEVATLDKIARDMTLLAELVMRRRRAKPENGDGCNQESPVEVSNDLGEFAFAPLRIALLSEDEAQTVGSVAQAVECLTTKWPLRYGVAFEEALQACIDGVKGRVSPGHVRSAFVHAVDAAGMRILL